MLSRLRSLARKGFRIPFLAYRVRIEPESDGEDEVAHSARLRHIERLLECVPELERYHDPSTTTDPLAAEAFLGFADGYVPLLRDCGREAHLRNLLTALSSTVSDESWRKRLTLEVAASNVRDGVPDSRIYSEVVGRGVAPADLGVPDDVVEDYRKHEAAYGARVPYFDFMQTLAAGGGLLRDKTLRRLFENHRELIAGKRILHIAAERSLRDWFRGNADAWNFKYLSADLFKEADVRLDVTAASLPAESFDLIICHRVLEHVLDDSAALREFHRLLAPGGLAQLSVPEGMQRPNATEYLIGDRSFHGHVRIYGRDFAERAAAAGFRVEVVSDPLQMTDEEHREHGTYPMRIYHCWKDA